MALSKMYLSESTLKILQNMIGRCVKFGLVPHMFIDQSVGCPFDGYIAERGELFMRCSALSLRVDGLKDYIVIEPAPNVHVLALEKTYERSKWELISVNLHKKPLLYEWSKRQLKDCVDHDNNLYAEGFARASFYQFSPIISIDIHRFDEMSGFVFTHKDGQRWCLYTDFDTTPWFSYDEKVVCEFESISDEHTTIS